MLDRAGVAKLVVSQSVSQPGHTQAFQRTTKYLQCKLLRTFDFQCDFGIARKVSGANKHGVTMMTGGVGTFQYMAPEVLDADYGVSKAGLAVDVYSFGMLVCIVVRAHKSYMFSTNLQCTFLIMCPGSHSSGPCWLGRSLGARSRAGGGC